jgi:hypothetical protein
MASHVGPVGGGIFHKKRRWNRRFPVIHKHQVLRSLTPSKAIPGAYSSYEKINMACFTFMHVIIVHYM